MRRALVIALLLSVSFTAGVAKAEFYSMTPFVISELRSDWSPSEGLVIVPPPGVLIPNRAACGPTPNWVPDGVGLLATTKGYTTLSSLLMAAFLGGKQVRLHFQSPYTCAIGRPALVGVDVIN